MVSITAQIIVEGNVQGEILRLSEPLSLWGGLNPDTGEITDRHHPQSGEIVTGKIIVMPSGRGSSSASSILLESVRQGTAPVGFILREMDGIIALGAVVAREIYDVQLPVVVVSDEGYERLQTRKLLAIKSDGGIALLS